MVTHNYSWTQLTHDPQEVGAGVVLHPPRVNIQWYPLAPHYCCWDEFANKEFVFTKEHP